MDVGHYLSAIQECIIWACGLYGDGLMKQLDNQIWYEQKTNDQQKEASFKLC